jgi:hypothetical protein
MPETIFFVSVRRANYHDVELKSLWTLTPCIGADKCQVYEGIFSPHPQDYRILLWT